MEVILKEDVAKLGSRGDVVKVAEGYGRNYLLPKKLAIEATPANRAVIEQMKAAAVRRLAREKGDAEALGKQLAGVELSFHPQVGRARSALRFRHLGRHRARAGAQGPQHRSPQDPARRAAESRRRLQRARQAAQGRRRAGEGDHPEGSDCRRCRSRRGGTRGQPRSIKVQDPADAGLRVGVRRGVASTPSQTLYLCNSEWLSATRNLLFRLLPGNSSSLYKGLRLD